MNPTAEVHTIATPRSQHALHHLTSPYRLSLRREQARRTRRYTLSGCSPSVLCSLPSVGVHSDARGEAFRRLLAFSMSASTMVNASSSEAVASKLFSSLLPGYPKEVSRLLLVALSATLDHGLREDQSQCEPPLSIIELVLADRSPDSNMIATWFVVSKSPVGAPASVGLALPLWCPVRPRFSTTAPAPNRAAAWTHAAWTWRPFCGERPTCPTSLLNLPLRLSSFLHSHISVLF